MSLSTATQWTAAAAEHINRDGVWHFLYSKRVSATDQIATTTKPPIHKNALLSSTRLQCFSFWSIHRSIVIVVVVVICWSSPTNDHSQTVRSLLNTDFCRCLNLTHVWPRSFNISSKYQSKFITLIGRCEAALCAELSERERAQDEPRRRAMLICEPIRIPFTH